MNRLRTAVVRSLHDPLQVQVRVGRRGATDVVGLVCVADVDGVGVRV